MLLSVCHVVWSRSTKAVIQQYIETENRTSGPMSYCLLKLTVSLNFFKWALLTFL